MFQVWTASHVREAQKECRVCMTNNEGIQPGLDILSPRDAGVESRDRSFWPEGEAMFPSADHLEYCNEDGFVKREFNSKGFFPPPKMNI